MSCVHYCDDELFLENVRLADLAEKFSTPCYVYSAKTITNNYKAFNTAFSALPHRICYAVKSNSNIAILNLLAKLGAGFDIVSSGELQRVIAAGGDPAKIIFSGVGKTHHDILAGIRQKIFCFNVESVQELQRIADIAAQENCFVNIALRVNPNINPNTHEYIATGLKDNKFGMSLSELPSITKIISKLKSVKLIGVAAHIGSQITNLEPFEKNISLLVDLYHRLHDEGIKINTINAGGGLGITYSGETPPPVKEYADTISKKLKDIPVELIIEPGRAIVGNAGILLTRVEYIKSAGDKNYAITDAGMNDLLRPALYNARHEILPVITRQDERLKYDIAGPVCESADFLGKECNLAIKPGDLLAITCAGAYGFSMSSNYNSRCKPAEIIISGKHAHLVRRRETIEDSITLEKLITE